MVSQEIVRTGKPYAIGEFIKRCFINTSEALLRDFRNKTDIKKKVKELTLCIKLVKDRRVKMSKNITNQKIEDLKLVSALSIVVDES